VGCGERLNAEYDSHVTARGLSGDLGESTEIAAVFSAHLIGGSRNGSDRLERDSVMCTYLTSDAYSRGLLDWRISLTWLTT